MEIVAEDYIVAIHHLTLKALQKGNETCIQNQFVPSTTLAAKEADEKLAMSRESLEFDRP